MYPNKVELEAVVSVALLPTNGMVRLSRLEQPLKAWESMDFTLSPIVMLVILEQL